MPCLVSVVIDQFAVLAFRHLFARLRVDDLGIEHIAEDVQAILVMAFLGDARDR